MADDIQAEVLALVRAEIDKQRFGEDYGAAVSFAVAPGPGGQPVPVWTLLITARNPLLGEGPLWHPAQIPAPRPDGAMVQAVVADGLRRLRDLAASKLAGSNGRAPVKAGRG